ncbi:non-hydrolyzing UDP-N-acetylglucosamine 2-epimerase [Curtanaerobium respiraculi]|uniref:non-hydrolyzing UDP-N-acetylglucosamine 2-epimerase n=1 Tax=Curtanaerobium respiraculi TaxID=2949669 RepID=UPI0024B3C73C|nr:UDP-N-acetylglucosamine 2-epimerase (non-hydrolyzing) [Curtanaerobium respiraculi]
MEEVDVARRIPNVFTVFGTRPEAVKMAPVVKALEGCPEINSTVCITGQHRQMCLDVLRSFGIDPRIDLGIIRVNQTLTTITCDVLERLDDVFNKKHPDLVLVHGDTSSSMAAALAAFYRHIPVGHVEAGLRSGNRYSPFPEEMNRRLISRLATLHFAPTEGNARFLADEGISDQVIVTGNSVIDSFAYTVRPDYQFKEPILSQLDFSQRIVLVTAHRRENWGRNLEAICSSITELGCEFPDIRFVYPVHPNPIVHDAVHRLLGNDSHVILTGPIDILDMHNLLPRIHLVMTDSGGLQEEAPHFGKPVAVLRMETERPEAIEVGTAILVHPDTHTIVEEVGALLRDSARYAAMAHAVNPYGDGHASERILRAVASFLDCER